MGDEAGQPHRVHVHAALGPPAPGPGERARFSVGSAAHAPAPAASRAACMRRTVSSEVPEGASRLRSWWSSMTSAPPTNGAHSSAQRIMRAAPMEKFAATTAWALPENQLPHRLEVGLVEARSCRTPRARRDRRTSARLSRAACGDGEVDRHLGPGLDQAASGEAAISSPVALQAGDLVERPACGRRVDGRDELEVAGPRAPPRRRPPPCARRRRSTATLVSRRSPTRQKGPTTASVLGPDEHLLGDGFAPRRR